MSAYAAWHQMVPICTEWWCTEANEATQTQCCNPVAPVYPIWAYYAHGRQRRCQEDPVSLPSGRLGKTTMSSPHHVAQHCPTGSKTTAPYAPEAADLAKNCPQSSISLIKQITILIVVTLFRMIFCGKAVVISCFWSFEKSFSQTLQSSSNTST